MCVGATPNLVGTRVIQITSIILASHRGNQRYGGWARAVVNHIRENSLTLPGKSFVFVEKLRLGRIKLLVYIYELTRWEPRLNGRRLKFGSFVSTSELRIHFIIYQEILIF
jgi:hypothetical protein